MEELRYDPSLRGGDDRTATVYPRHTTAIAARRRRIDMHTRIIFLRSAESKTQNYRRPAIECRSRARRTQHGGKKRTERERKGYYNL